MAQTRVEYQPSLAKRLPGRRSRHARRHRSLRPISGQRKRGDGLHRCGPAQSSQSSKARPGIPQAPITADKVASFPQLRLLPLLSHTAQLTRIAVLQGLTATDQRTPRHTWFRDSLSSWQSRRREGPAAQRSRDGQRPATGGANTVFSINARIETPQSSGCFRFGAALSTAVLLATPPVSSRRRC